MKYYHFCYLSFYFHFHLIMEKYIHLIVDDMIFEYVKDHFDEIKGYKDRDELWDKYPATMKGIREKEYYKGVLSFWEQVEKMRRDVSTPCFRVPPPPSSKLMTTDEILRLCEKMRVEDEEKEHQK